MNRIVYKLPEVVRVCKNADQVRPIRVYKHEGKQMSKYYMRMFGENRIMPHAPYELNGHKYVDAVVGEKPYNIPTYRKNTNSYSAEFKKKLQNGLLLTPTYGVVVVDDNGRLKRQQLANEKLNLTTEVRSATWSPGQKEGSKKMTKKQIKEGLRAKDRFYDTFMKGAASC
jgi:hypothetical protein